MGRKSSTDIDLDDEGMNYNIVVTINAARRSTIYVTSPLSKNYLPRAEAFSYIRLSADVRGN